MVDDRVRSDHQARVPTTGAEPAAYGTAVLKCYASLRRELDNALGVTLFPFHGTLLRIVREHVVIGQEGDFATAYISEHSAPAEVRDEFKHVCHHLLSRGYTIDVETTHAAVNVPDSSARITIDFAWFTAAGTFDASNGYRGTPLQRSAEFFDFRTEKLSDVDVPVPRNADTILAQLYDSDWQTPNARWVPDITDRARHEEYLLATGDLTELHWSQFYRDHEPDRASRFAEFVADRFPSPGAIVEFGSGTGRDGIYFANRGWVVVGCDRSPEAVARANEVLRASGGLAATFATADVASDKDVQNYLTAHTATLDEANPLIVYMRFFLHAIDEPTQNSLLTTLAAAIARDFYLCAEFRTLSDRYLTKHHGVHYRRYIDHEKLAAQLDDRWGFVVQHIEASQGLSPYDGEDPHLARIVAFRPQRKDAVGDG